MHLQAPRMFSLYLPTTVLSLLYHLRDSRHDHLNSPDVIILNSSLKEGSSNCCQQKRSPDWAIEFGDQEATSQRDLYELYMLPSLQSCTLISLSLDCLSPNYVMGLKYQLLPGRASWASCVSMAISTTLRHAPAPSTAGVCLPSCSVNSWRARIIILSSGPKAVAAQRRYLLNK